MFFENPKDVSMLAQKSSSAVFVMPKNTPVEIKNAFLLAPEEGKNVISIEQVRNIISKFTVKQTSDVFVVISPADALNEEASNALLKTLEEPGAKLHFILITEEPSKLLQTILSRSNIYFLRTKWSADEILADEKIKAMAKRLITAKASDLPSLAEEITKKKDGVRENTSSVLAVSIEMLYKAYFKTGNVNFVKKIPKFLAAYEAISRNGHVKLHLVADLC